MFDQSYLWWEVMSRYVRLWFLHFNEIYHDPVNLWTSDSLAANSEPTMNNASVTDFTYIFASKKCFYRKTPYLTPNVHDGIVISILRQQHFAKMKTVWWNPPPPSPIRPSLYYNPLFSGPDSAVNSVLYNLGNTSTPLLRRTITFCCS